MASFLTLAMKSLHYLKSPDVKPFVILSDINMPIVNGFELREKIHQDEEMNARCVPYLFVTTDASSAAIRNAYKLSVQGIFQKPSNMKDWVDTIHELVTYWKRCMSPH